ncbi:MAG: HPF/RaiA family ribosome-associated protein [Chitinophagaceae bacterium]|nr:HPF/RaiA family ribosome-associated protein [Chitinophagaceae bacterium]
MNIIIQSLGFTAGAALETLIKKKICVLKSDSIIRATVTLYKGPAENMDADYCEIRLEVPGNDLYVKKNSTHFEVSASECVEVLSQQLNKKATKKNDRQADTITIENVLAAAEGDTDATQVTEGPQPFI